MKTPPRVKLVLKRVLQAMLTLIMLIVVALTIIFFYVSAPPETPTLSHTSVNDVTMLNEISVANICRPTSVDSIQKFVRNWNGKLSIGGARHSMGGQIAIEQSLHFDMRSFKEIVAFSAEAKEITVQTGITWRAIQEFIDPYNLSVMIMQTYADFTVGGSLSVNVHGRYIGKGPIIHSIKSIEIVLADGRLLKASREENPDIFAAAIGGYGGFGIIVTATLLLEENTKVKRISEVMEATDYHTYFFQNIRDNPDVVFHNADLYPDHYTKVRAVSYLKTEEPLTINERLIPTDNDYRMERFAMWAVSELPGGKWMRENWGDPIAYDQEKICYRNYEASYNASELEPRSRKHSTYVLQEYFIPVEHFESFVPKMAEVFTTHEVNVINVSIRHAHADTLSYLAWAPREVFCFVIYYKQETSPEAQKAVGVWTRSLIEAALSEGGSYYLPYQLHATPSQFQRAYPRAKESFALKATVDSSNKFSNRFWAQYFREPENVVLP